MALAKSRPAKLLPASWSADRVQELLATLYAFDRYTQREQLQHLSRPRSNPYPAYLGQTATGERWAGEIICGHNPHLVARLARVAFRPDGELDVAWLPRPTIRKLRP